MSNKHSDTVQDESLSALMDGEAQELELRRLLRQLPDDPNLRARWARYQLASSVIRKQQFFPVGSLKLADAVQAAIQKDFSYEANTAGTWRRGAARFAVAASVALAVVAGAQWKQQQTAATTQLATAGPAATKIYESTALLESVASMPLLASKPLAGSAFIPVKDRQYGYMQNNLERASLNTLNARGSMAPLAPAADRLNKGK